MFTRWLSKVLERKVLRDSDTLAGGAELEGEELLLHVVRRADPHVLTASLDGTVSIFDSGGTRCFTKDGFHKLVGISATTCGLWLAACADGLVHVFDGGNYLCNIQGSPRQRQNATISPDGVRIVMPAGDRTVKSFDPRSGRCLLAYSDFDSDVCWVMFSPDGSSLLCVTERGFASLLGTSGQRVHMSQAGKWCHRTHFMWHGQAILAVLRDGTARLFDTASGLDILHLHENHAVSDAVVSPDDSHMVLVFNDCTAKLHNWKNHRVVSSLVVANLGHYIAPQPVRFSGDGTNILFALDTCDVRVLHANSGDTVSICKGGKHHITAACFSADARMILVSYYTSSLALFETESGICVRQLASGLSAVIAAEFAHLPACATGLLKEQGSNFHADSLRAAQASVKAAQLCSCTGRKSAASQPSHLSWHRIPSILCSLCFNKSLMCENADEEPLFTGSAPPPGQYAEIGGCFNISHVLS